MLLDVLLGAEIRFLKNNDANDDLTAAMDEWILDLRSRRPQAVWNPGWREHGPGFPRVRPGDA